jgi:ketosteroid isomerase-like protein
MIEGHLLTPQTRIGRKAEMLDRDEMLASIEKAYEARVRGDKKALAGFFAANASFRIVGDDTLVGGVPFRGETPMDAIGELVDRFTFSDVERLATVVEGNKAAVRRRVTVTVPGKPPVGTELFDLIEFDDMGKITSFAQFADTALVRHLAE